MRIIIKPAGMIALALSLLLLVGLMGYQAIAGKSNKGATGITTAAELPAAPNVPVPVAYLFQATEKVSPSPTGGIPVTGELMNGAESKEIPNGSSTLVLDSKNKQYATTGKPLVDTTKSFSVSAWARLTTNDNGFHTFVSQDGTTISGFYLQRRNSGRFSFTVNSDDSVTPAIRRDRSDWRLPGGVELVAQPGTWYHLLGLYDSKTHSTKLYVNGKLQQTKKLPAEVHLWAAKGPTLIGAGRWDGNTVDFTNGTVENVRVYPRVLTDAEVEVLRKKHQ